jgi:hypothetical protein
MDYIENEPEFFEVWPDCWETFELFCKVKSQWRVSMGGPCGLDYVPLFRLMDRMNLEPDEWDRIFSEIQAMEAEALATLSANAPTT